MTYSVIIKKENGCTIGFTGVKEIIESPIGYHFEFGGLLYRHTVCKDGKALANCDTYTDAVEYIKRKTKEELEWL